MKEERVDKYEREAWRRLVDWIDEQIEKEHQRYQKANKTKQLRILGRIDTYNKIRGRVISFIPW